MEKEKPARFQFRLRTLPIVLVVVIFLIAIWSALPRGFGFFVGGRPSHHGPHGPGITGHMIAQLVVAMENFKIDYNQYPWPNDAPPPVTSMADILREFMPTDPRLTKGKSPVINVARETYLEIPEKHVKNGTLADPWGNEYLIVYVKGPIIWSQGPNGIDETSDGDEKYGDDIANVRYKH